MLHVVWMDGRQAECYALHPNGKFEHGQIIKHDYDHHTHSHRDDKHPPEAYFKSLMQALHGAEEILLVGPGLPKEHFKHYVVQHSAHDISNHIVGMESAERLTENQIKALAIETFKRLHPHFPVN